MRGPEAAQQAHSHFLGQATLPKPPGKSIDRDFQPCSLPPNSVSVSLPCLHAHPGFQDLPISQPHAITCQSIHQG